MLIRKSCVHPSSGPTKADSQGSELAHRRICIIRKSLGCTEVLVLPIRSDPIRSCRISMTEGNNRITWRSPSEDPILMVSQMPEISNRTNDSS